MIFDTKEWGYVLKHYPLRIGEITALGISIQQSAEVAAALVRWGESIATRRSMYAEWILQPDGSYHRQVCQ